MGELFESVEVWATRDGAYIVYLPGSTRDEFGLHRVLVMRRHEGGKVTAGTASWLGAPGRHDASWEKIHG